MHSSNTSMNSKPKALAGEVAVLTQLVERQNPDMKMWPSINMIVQCNEGKISLDEFERHVEQFGSDLRMRPVEEHIVHYLLQSQMSLLKRIHENGKSKNDKKRPARKDEEEDTKSSVQGAARELQSLLAVKEEVFEEFENNVAFMQFRCEPDSAGTSGHQSGMKRSREEVEDMHMDSAECETDEDPLRGLHTLFGAPNPQRKWESPQQSTLVRRPRFHCPAPKCKTVLTTLSGIMSHEIVAHFRDGRIHCDKTKNPIKLSFIPHENLDVARFDRLFDSLCTCPFEDCGRNLPGPSRTKEHIARNHRGTIVRFKCITCDSVRSPPGMLRHLILDCPSGDYTVEKERALPSFAELEHKRAPTIIYD